MLAIIEYNKKPYKINFSKPIDISLPLKDGFFENPNCFFAPPVEIFPVKTDSFIGDTQQGGLVNFKNVKINPHGNGTHTECVGHISKEVYNIDQCLKQFMFKAQVVSIYPEKQDNGDLVITRRHLEMLIDTPLNFDAIVIRTLPNDDYKKKAQYSGTNPCYFHHDATRWLVEHNISHLITDLPSVDREEDGGKLLAHHEFWRYPNDIRENCTITELAFIPNNVKDGDYFLQFQITSLQMDASPSKPVLYKVI